MALTEISPSNPHPVSVAAGAGYMVAAGFGQFALGGKSWDAVDVSAVALGSIIAPTGVPAGALQLGALVGTLNNIVAVGPLLTPYSALGGGFLQGGHPGTAWGLVLNIPLSFGSYSPPVGIAQGALGLPRGGTWDLGALRVPAAAPPAVPPVSTDRGF